MKKFLLLIVSALMCMAPATAQRVMENLDRGLVAMKKGNGVYLSWRLLGQEWYDVNYNVYRDGTRLNAEPLATSNYYDASGTTSSSYTVRAVVRGVEQEDCKAVTPWKAQYMDIPMQSVKTAAGVDITGKYTLNDASAADLDGDGDYELIVKRQNTDFTKANTAYTLFQAYTLEGTLLWTINVGPNMINASHVETNCMAYDFNMDGKAEVVIRLTDGSILPDGTTVGNATVNYRPISYSDGNTVYQTQGDEWLYVLEGETGAVIDNVKFDETTNNLARRSAAFWWGNNSKAYGHRANKFHFGAPYLDGRKPSIYVGRGCYTNIHMATFDLVDNKLKLRWTYANDNSGSKFYGQGYHNFSIVDVDEDGRDEICHGNMVIDEYGKELSSTGLGHGDAQHYGDLDPYRKGIEGFRCLEDNPGAVFVDAATNEILFRWMRGRDNGRALAGNFTDNWPGAEMWTTDGKLWSASLSRGADETVANSAPGVTMNFRIYWDGDILEESFDYVNGYDTDGAVFKYGNSSPIFTTSGCATNNHTKGNPCIQADLFGDWREEIVLRTSDNKNLRIYTTTDVTAHRNYTLMHDKQYRQAIYWQMSGYNQPPHVSYFLGKAEGITVPPPPVMDNGRTVVTGAITADHTGQHVLLTDEAGGEVNVAEGAAPYILTVNGLKKDWTLKGAAFAGDMRLVKQGQAALTFSGDQAYTGVTELWEGVTNFEGSLQSPVWVNRFAELNTAAIYNKGITMEYGAILRVAGADNKGTVTASDLNLKKGAVVELDIYSDDFSADKVSVNNKLALSAGTVFRFVQHNKAGDSAPAAGDYLIAEADEISGSLANVTIEGLQGVSCELKQDGGKIFLSVAAMRSAGSILWSGVQGNVWDLFATENFLLEAQGTTFVTGDSVVFDETATVRTVTINEEVVPAAVVVKGDADYTFQGKGNIGGGASFHKEGTGTLTVNNVNDYTGKTVISGGMVKPASLATAQSAGALGALSNDAGNFVMEHGAVMVTTGDIFQESPMTMGEGGGVFTVNSGNLHLKGLIKGTTLTKNGAGTLQIYGRPNSYKKTIINGGTLKIAEEYNSTTNGRLGDTIVFNNGVLQCLDNSYSYSSASWNIVVPEGKNGTIRLDGRCNYTGSLTGAGTLNVYIPYVRTYLQGNWSKFAGTIVCSQSSSGDFTFDNSYGLPLATLSVTEGCTVRNNKNTNMKIAAAEGSGTLGGDHGWTIGNDSEEINRFSGKIAGKGSLTKVGSNTLQLSGENTYTGATNVNAGTLTISNRGKTVSATGTGVLTVKNGGTFTGNGYIGNSVVSIASGGLLIPGAYNIGSLTMPSTLNLQVGGAIEWRLNSAKSVATLKEVKTMTLNGTLRVTLKEGYTPALGDSFSLWSCNAVSENSVPTLELPELPEGLAWDTTDLLTTTGTLRVMDATGLRLTAWDEPVQATVFTLEGVAVESFEAPYNQVAETLSATSLPRGLYIVKMDGQHGSGAIKVMKE